MTYVVDLDHVFRVYATEEGGSAALQGLTFAVREGEIVVTRTIRPQGSRGSRTSRQRGAQGGVPSPFGGPVTGRRQ